MTPPPVFYDCRKQSVCFADKTGGGVTENSVEVTIRLGIRGINAGRVRRAVANTLTAEKVKRKSVSVLLTGNRESRRINRRYLKHDDATDVISFGSGEKNYLGDIVVSAELAGSFSRKLRIPYRQELSRYVVHGTLHLLGYEDRSKKGKIRMMRRQELILKKIFRNLLRPSKL